MIQALLTLFVVLFAPIPWIICVIHILVKKGIWNSFASKAILLIVSLSAWTLIGVWLLSNGELLFVDQFTNIAVHAIGVLVLMMALLIEVLTHKALGTKRIFGSSEFQQSKDQLITHGIYKYARHPRYVEHPLWALGLGMAFGYPSLIWFFLYLAIGFVVLAYVEEQELVKRYGKQYLDYRKKTPAFFIPCSFPAVFHMRKK